MVRDVADLFTVVILLLIFIYKCKKTAVCTNVNGDIVSYASKNSKNKKVILPSNTSPNVK